MPEQVVLYNEDQNGNLIPADWWARAGEILQTPIYAVGTGADITVLAIEVPVGKTLTIIDVIQGSSDDLGYICITHSTSNVWNLGTIVNFVIIKGRGELWNPAHPILTINNTLGVASQWCVIAIPNALIGGFVNSNPARTFYGNMWYILQ